MSDVNQQPLISDLEAFERECPEEGASLDVLTSMLGERAFGAAIFVLALPVAIPFLYLIPQMVAVPMTILALQMLIGRRRIWLPWKLGERVIPKDGLGRMTRFARKYFGWLERLTKPRLQFLASSLAERIIGFFLAFFCMSILVPIPGTNTIPGIGAAIASFGLVNRDGLFILLGLLIGVLWLSFLIYALYALVVLGTNIFDHVSSA